MFYEYRLTIPANTPADDPETLEIKLAPGRIIAMAVGLPRGCVGLVHAQVWYGLNIHWPSNPDSSISGDAVTVEWQESYDLDPTAPVLRIVGWNLDDSYDHTITFRLNVLAKETIDRMESAMAALDYLARWYKQNPVSR